MRVALPSLGILGTKYVDLRPVRFDDLRAFQEMNQQEEIMKCAFVRKLLNGVDYSKITKMDLDYLYLISAFSVVFNTVSFNITCSNCGLPLKRDFNLSDMDVINIPKGISVPLKEKVDGIDYEYTILSAQDYFDCLDYALTQEDFEVSLEKSMVCKILNKSLDSVNEFIDNISVGVYLSAFLFQQVCFHGVNMNSSVECPECHTVNEVRLRVPISTIKIDLAKLMEIYATISDKASFESFLKFTIPEFRLLVEALNNKTKNG